MSSLAELEELIDEIEAGTGYDLSLEREYVKSLKPKLVGLTEEQVRVVIETEMEEIKRRSYLYSDEVI